MQAKHGYGILGQRCRQQSTGTSRTYSGDLIDEKWANVCKGDAWRREAIKGRLEFTRMAKQPYKHSIFVHSMQRESHFPFGFPIEATGYCKKCRHSSVSECSCYPCQGSGVGSIPIGRSIKSSTYRLSFLSAGTQRNRSCPTRWPDHLNNLQMCCLVLSFSIRTDRLTDLHAAGEGMFPGKVASVSMGRKGCAEEMHWLDDAKLRFPNCIRRLVSVFWFERGALACE